MEDLETTQPIPPPPRPKLLKVTGRIIHDGFLASYRLPKVVPMVFELSVETSHTFADIFGHDPRNHTGRLWRQQCQHAPARRR